MKTKIEPEQIELNQLSKYRRQLNLSAQQIADNMRVSMPIVTNIESGQFDKIGSAPFIRGHVINYCKALELDASHVLAQIPGQLLAHKNVQRPDAFLPASVSRARLKTRHYGRYVLGTTLLTVLTVSAYFIWDKWGLMSEVDPSLQLLNGDKETVTYSSIIPPVQKVGALSNNDIQTSDGQSGSVLSTEGGTGSSDKNIEGESESIISDSDSEEGDVSHRLLAAEESDLIVADKFVIEFDLQEQAWVSITTETGDKLVHDLIGPGLRQYESDKPLVFRIGNSDKLDLRINGKPIDITQFADKNLAKFSWPFDS